MHTSGKFNHREDKQFFLKQKDKGRSCCMFGTEIKLVAIEKRKTTFK